jgi:hypothetical protein
MFIFDNFNYNRNSFCIKLLFIGAIILVLRILGQMIKFSNLFAGNILFCWNLNFKYYF